MSVPRLSGSPRRWIGRIVVDHDGSVRARCMLNHEYTARSQLNTPVTFLCCAYPFRLGKTLIKEVIHPRDDRPIVRDSP